MWKGPEIKLEPIKGLTFADLRHRFEPGWFAAEGERIERANRLGRYIIDGTLHRHFGLVPPGRRDGLRFEEPVIESIRSLRRLTPDDELDFHIVAEVTQRVQKGNRSYMGGSTVVLDAEARVRYLVVRNVANWDRHRRTDTFLARSPAEYRAAFEADEWSPGAVIRRFHARGHPRSRGKSR